MCKKVLISIFYTSKLYFMKKRGEGYIFVDFFTQNATDTLFLHIA